MTYRVLAREYRPRTFDEVVGQQAIAQTLRNSIELGKVAHAYLFTGPRGVGKTTMARILAKALNCWKGTSPQPCNQCESCIRIQEGTDIDVPEIDGASNNRVEEVRTLRSNIQYHPVRSRFKIYIIDEVHMLTISAFNALLKTLEEPPAHVKFIFATTEPHKLPETIISRCQRFDFRRIPSSSIVELLRTIAEREKLKVADDVLWSIARYADGGLRDALSLLDQLNAWEEQVTPEKLRELLGLLPRPELGEIVAKLRKGDLGSVLPLVARSLEQGIEPSALAEQLVQHYRDLLVVKCCGTKGPVEASEEVLALLDSQKELYSEEELLYVLSILAQCMRWMKTLGSSRTALELGLLKIAKLGQIQRLSELSREATAYGSGDESPAASGVSEPSPPDTEKPAAPAKRARPANAKKHPHARAPQPPPPPAEEADTAPPQQTESPEWEAFYRALPSQTLQGFIRAADERKVEGERLILRYKTKFPAERVAQPQNREAVEQASRQAFGRPLQLVVEVGASATTIHEDPGVAAALKIFRGRIVKEE